MISRKMALRRFVLSIALLAAIFIVLTLVQPKDSAHHAEASEHAAGVEAAAKSETAITDVVKAASVCDSAGCKCDTCRCCGCNR